MLALGGTNTGIFKLLLVAHILCAIVGLGAVMLNGVYAAQAAKRPVPQGRAVSEANLFVSTIGEYFIYAIFVFGILLAVFSDGAIKFSQTWLWLAMLIYVVTLGVTHSILIPGHKRTNALLAELEQAPTTAGGAPPQTAELQAIGKRMAAAGMYADLAVVAILVLMIWRPGQ